MQESAGRKIREKFILHSLPRITNESRRANVRHVTGNDQDYLRESPERLFRYLRFSKRATVGVRATSNGKSSIVEERLYSLFFAFFPQKNEVSYFRFFSSTQLITKTFVLLRSCKILKSSLRSASFSQIFGTSLFVLPSISNKLG